jgi:cardiolipin synthase
MSPLFSKPTRKLKADGYLARRYNSQTVLGTILDPAADKALVTTLAVTLTMKGLLPR